MSSVFGFRRKGGGGSRRRGRSRQEEKKGRRWEHRGGEVGRGRGEKGGRRGRTNCLWSNISAVDKGTCSGSRVRRRSRSVCTAQQCDLTRGHGWSNYSSRVSGVGFKRESQTNFLTHSLRRIDGSK